MHYSRQFDTMLIVFQALECCIADVVPLAGTWSAESCIATSQLIEGKLMKVMFLGTKEHSHVHAVDILLSQGKVKDYEEK